MPDYPRREASPTLSALPQVARQALELARPATNNSREPLLQHDRGVRKRTNCLSRRDHPQRGSTEIADGRASARSPGRRAGRAGIFGLQPACEIEQPPLRGLHLGGLIGASHGLRPRAIAVAQVFEDIPGLVHLAALDERGLEDGPHGFVQRRRAVEDHQQAPVGTQTTATDELSPAEIGSEGESNKEIAKPTTDDFMPSPCGQALVVTTEFAEPSRRRCGHERAVPLRYLHQLRSTPLVHLP